MSTAWLKDHGAVIWSDIAVPDRETDPCANCGAGSSPLAIFNHNNKSFGLCEECLEDTRALQELASKPVVLNRFTGKWLNDDWDHPLPFTGQRAFVFDPPLTIHFEVVAVGPSDGEWVCPCLVGIDPFSTDDDYPAAYDCLSGDDPDAIAREIATSLVDLWQYAEAKQADYMPVSRDADREWMDRCSRDLAFIRPEVPLPPHRDMR